MLKNLLSLLMLFALSQSLSAQTFSFKAPVDYDYGNMRQVVLDSTTYQTRQRRKGRFVVDPQQPARPIDYGGKVGFGAHLVEGGDHAVLTPSHHDMHQRQTALYAHGNGIFLAQNVIGEEAETRLDTAYMMNFKVRRLMTQDVLPADYDGPFELETDLSPDSTTTASILEMANATGDTLSLRMDHRARTLTLAQGGLRAEMPVGQAIDEDMPDLWHLNVFVSRHSAEVFVNEGRAVLSHPISLQRPLATVRLLSERGKTKFSNITIYRKPQAPLRLRP